MLIPVILCGGSGSRLWPVSREQSPKPFIRLDDGDSLIQKAFLKALSITELNDVYTVANKELFFRAKNEFDLVNKSNVHTSFILETQGRNTAAAIATATIQIYKKYGENSTLVILAADHLILNAEAFTAALNLAKELAAADKIVTFGIQPSSPETGYGYIEVNGNEVIRFVEKPDLETANEYVNSGNFLWNSGMFCFKAKTMLAELKIHAADVLEKVMETLESSKEGVGEGFTHLTLDDSCFQSVPDVSIDYAVMEKSQNIAVVPCDIGWFDIGSWSALSDLTPADELGNRIKGEVLLHDVTNCSVNSRHHTIGMVGVENLIVVEANDAILIAHKDRTQDVKEIYARLKASNHQTYKFHLTAHRPWGMYTILDERDGFKVKRILVKPGASLSLQHHHQRSEHWIVVKGTATVVNGDDVLTLQQNESTYIPAGQKHRLVNNTNADVVIVEVQCGQYLGEDDIVRHEDIYIRF